MMMLSILVTVLGFLNLSYISYIHYRINRLEDLLEDYI